MKGVSAIIAIILILMIVKPSIMILISLAGYVSHEVLLQMRNLQKLHRHFD